MRQRRKKVTWFGLTRKRGKRRETNSIGGLKAPIVQLNKI